MKTHMFSIERDEPWETLKVRESKLVMLRKENTFHK